MMPAGQGGTGHGTTTRQRSALATHPTDHSQPSDRSTRRMSCTQSNITEAMVLIESNPSLSRFAGPRKSDLIQAASLALNVIFPEDYRIFLQRFGAGSFGWFSVYGVIDSGWKDSSVPDAVWRTLTERTFGFSDDLIIIDDMGDGSLTAIEIHGERSRIVLCQPGSHSEFRELVSDSFGSYLLNSVKEVISVR